MQNNTIVTGFFDIGRDKWPKYNRKLAVYLSNALRNLELDVNMVIFIESKLEYYVKKCREIYPNKTHIVVMKLEDLPKYQLRDKIKNIMDSDDFKNGIKCPNVPEMWNPDYNIVVWSKIDLLQKAIEINPFHSTHFGWLDFGIGDYCRIENLSKVFPDKIRILCRSQPQVSDLDRVKMCKSHTNRFAAGFFTGEKNYLLYFIHLVNQEIDKCLELNVVDCEQTMFSNVYLQYKDLFELYYGDWSNIQ